MSNPQTYRIISASDTGKSIDLFRNEAQEGQAMNIWANDPNSPAQRWVIKKHVEGGYTIQAGTSYGFFQAATQGQGQAVVFTKTAWLWNMKHVSDDEYRLETEDGEYALTVRSDTNDGLMLDNIQETLDRQRWKFDPPLPEE
ncbi:hypothetical protein FRC19_010351 [Serendipita sp. 401]|nr:hypothetical protein FRC19_010351 [Serendipita sp. 401]KAG9052244.1 hypothetical protein FS842_010252 [Serendipita sp. 407]